MSSVIADCMSCVANRVSRIANRTSHIAYRKSRIAYRKSRIACRNATGGMRRPMRIVPHLAVSGKRSRCDPTATIQKQKQRGIPRCSRHFTYYSSFLGWIRSQRSHALRHAASDRQRTPAPTGRCGVNGCNAPDPQSQTQNRIRLQAGRPKPLAPTRLAQRHGRAFAFSRILRGHRRDGTWRAPVRGWRD